MHGSTYYLRGICVHWSVSGSDVDCSWGKEGRDLPPFCCAISSPETEEQKVWCYIKSLLFTCPSILVFEWMYVRGKLPQMVIPRFLVGCLACIFNGQMHPIAPLQFPNHLPISAQYSLYMSLNAALVSLLPRERWCPAKYIDASEESDFKSKTLSGKLRRYTRALSQSRPASASHQDWRRNFSRCWWSCRNDHANERRTTDHPSDRNRSMCDLLRPSSKKSISPVSCANSSRSDRMESRCYGTALPLLKRFLKVSYTTSMKMTGQGSCPFSASTSSRRNRQMWKIQRHRSWANCGRPGHLPARTTTTISYPLSAPYWRFCYGPCRACLTLEI